jgi:hypothetical protein
VTWADRLLSSESSLGLHAGLFEERARMGSWAAVLLFVERIETELSRRTVRNGRVTAIDALVARGRLEQVIRWSCSALSPRLGAPSVLLVRPDVGPATPGLALAELSVASSGWASAFSGAVSAENIRAHLAASRRPGAVVADAGAGSDPTLLAAWLRAVSAGCAERGVPLALIGAGAWPADDAHAHLLLDGLHGLPTWLLGLPPALA